MNNFEANSMKCSDSEIARKLSVVNQDIYIELQQMQKRSKDPKEKQLLSHTIRNISPFRCSALKESWDEVYFLHEDEDHWDFDKIEQEFLRNWVKKLNKLSLYFFEKAKLPIKEPIVYSKDKSLANLQKMKFLEASTSEKMAQLLKRMLDSSLFIIEQKYPDINEYLN